ncbi:MAG: 30S ribosomal protein S6 [Holosporales bacterium]|jgi:small subunit ribosomal protein S6|nr:30S ribosomal protein S6 [Holosporales bacterium]
MKFYEVVFIVRSDASSSHVEALAGGFVSIVRELGGEVTKTEFCGLRHLSYPIKKNKRGHYVLLNVTSDSDGVAELERRLRLDEDVIRSLITRVDKLDNNPSALMRKNFRDVQSRDVQSKEQA